MIGVAAVAVHTGNVPPQKEDRSGQRRRYTAWKEKIGGKKHFILFGIRHFFAPLDLHLSWRTG